MPAPRSAGILLFRKNGEVEVLLIRPGRPLLAKQGNGRLDDPEGCDRAGEAPAEAALREFEEETGTRLSTVPFPLATIRQAGGKYVEAFAVEGDLDPATIRSNEFEVEWPPRSGELRRFPEVVEARWMILAQARELMLPSQLPLLDALETKLEE